MDQMNPERRGMFGGLRAPFDLNMLALALAGVFGFWAMTELVEAMTSDANILQRMFDRLFTVVVTTGGPRGLEPLKPITWVLESAIILAFWSFFSAAISRIAAMKIAREETVDVREAAKFAAKKFIPVLSSVLFVATIILVFYVVCNATLAGFAMRIPVLDVVVSVLFFTVLLSTFFIVFSLVLGLFGMNLAASAIATESSDTWDGISRAWNYILVRPWHVLLCYALTFAYLGVFSFFANQFLSLSVSSLAIGPWGIGERTIVQEVDRADLPSYLQERVPESVKTARFLIPGKGEFLKAYLDGRMTGENATYNLSEANHKYVDAYRASLSTDAQTEVRNWNGGVNVVALIPTTWKISAAIIWFWLWLARLVIAAYAVQYFFAATTKLYFILRKEVEDEDYGEIVVEEEELEEEAAWDVKEPQKPVIPGATAPAGGLIMPKKLATMPSTAPATAGAAAPAAAPPAPSGGHAHPASPSAGAGAAPAAPSAPAPAASGEKKA